MFDENKNSYNDFLDKMQFSAIYFMFLLHMTGFVQESNM